MVESLWIIVPLVVLISILILRHQKASVELRRTKTLFDISLEMNSTIMKRELLQKIMTTTAEVMEAEGSSMILLDRTTGELYFEVAIGEKGDQMKEIRLDIGEGIAGWLLYSLIYPPF